MSDKRDVEKESAQDDAWEEIRERVIKKRESDRLREDFERLTEDVDWLAD